MRRESESSMGFTLIETLVAVSLLSVAIVAPMSLVAQSLTSAYYARDQVVAFNLAQEGIEAVRAIRDNNILQSVQSAGASSDLLAGIPIGQPFTIDARKSTPAEAISTCQSACPPLQIAPDGTLYGYETGWTNTVFTRTLVARYAGPNAINGGKDEIRLAITVKWVTATAQVRSFTIYENMFRWVQDGSAAQ